MSDLNTTQQTICGLIGAALFERELVLPPDVDWAAVYREATAHTVYGILYRILPQLPLPENIRAEWSTLYMHNVMRAMQLLHEQEVLIDLLEKNGIPNVILKGFAAAVYYPSLYDRAAGDVDFLVHESDYARTLRLLEDNEYQHAHEHEDNDRHESFDKNECHFECHHRFAGSHSGNAEIIDRWIKQGMQSAERVETESGAFFRLRDAENGLVLLEHVAIHIKAGLGLRQIVDWLLFVDQCLDDAAWAGEAGQIIRESGLETLAVTLTRMGQQYFGLRKDITWCSAAEDAVCGELLELVFSYGNFGRKAPKKNKVVSVMYRNRKGLFANLKAAGEHNWKALHRHPWLKPLAPVYQLFRYAKQTLSQKGTVRRIVSNRTEVAHRIALMEKLGI